MQLSGYLPALKLALTLTETPTLTGGNFPRGTIVRLPVETWSFTKNRLPRDGDEKQAPPQTPSMPFIGKASIFTLLKAWSFIKNSLRHRLQKYFISQSKVTQITLTEVALVSSTLNISLFVGVFWKQPLWEIVKNDFT